MPNSSGVLGTARSGLAHLREGEYEPIRRYLYDTVVSPLRRYRLVDAVYEEWRRGLYARPVTSATRTEGTTVELRDMSQDGKRYGRFTTAESLQFDPPFRFDAIEFDVGNVSERAGVRVRVTFDLDDGTTAEETVSFRNGSFHDRQTVSFAVDAPGTAEAASLSFDAEGSIPDVDVDADGWTKLDVDRPLLGEPRAASVDKSVGPIFLVSIDTFRYDYLDALGPLRDELGDDAVVPEEPRTQGISTWPSHASMFTGTHPSVHGSYSGNLGPRIDDSLPTLAAFLREQGYVTSGIASSSNLASEFGYGRGFDRYRVEDISWESRRFDASTVTETAREWVRTDARAGRENGFYFLHLFDAHYPYIPPEPRAGTEVDYEALDSIVDLVSNREYLRLLRDDPLNPDPSVLDLVQTYYRQSLEYVADELAAFVRELKRHGVFEESLIVVTGDHGEDFYERHFMFHNSLYDANIRPGMVVKPPADASFEVPDRVDTIDFFPTIADLVTGEVPETCAGTSWLRDDDDHEYRITERLLETYNVAVEHDGAKAIFTYPENNPNRPTDEQVDAGPIEREYYRLDGYDGDRERAGGLDEETKRRLREAAESFVRSGDETYTDVVGVEGDVKERLADLGYR